MRALLVVLLVTLAAGCGPWGPFPADWSFSDAHPLIAIETHGPLIRHAV
jgi:hypothetical protein